MSRKTPFCGKWFSGAFPQKLPDVFPLTDAKELAFTSDMPLGTWSSCRGAGPTRARSTRIGRRNRRYRPFSGCLHSPLNYRQTCNPAFSAGLAGGDPGPFGVEPTCILRLKAFDIARGSLMHNCRAWSTFYRKSVFPRILFHFPFRHLLGVFSARRLGFFFLTGAG